MGDEDKEAVQATVSVSQSSMELWYDGSEYAIVENQVFNELDQCLEGNYENGTYEVDGATYVCLDSEWRAVSLPGERIQPLFRNASLTTVAPTTSVCGPPAWGIWVTDGLGIAIGAKAGWSGGPGSIIVGAAIGASVWSGGFAIYRAYRRYREC